MTTQNKDADLSKSAAPKKENRLLKGFYLFMVRTLVVITVLFVLLEFFVGFTTASDGMFPNICPGDLVLFYRLDTGINAQDVVCFRKDGVSYIGRVVACSGDTVEITDGDTLLINGAHVRYANVFFDTPRVAGDVTYPLTLAENTYFVLGDYRTNSVDSRTFGAVAKAEIYGKVIAVFRRNNI